MADTLDVLTLAEAKAATSTADADTSKDTRLALYITAMSRMLDEEFGPIVVRAVTDNLTGGCCEVHTSKSPVLTFTTVTEYVNAVGQVLTAEDEDTTATYGYFPERYSNDPTLYSGFLTRRSSGSPTEFGHGMIKVVYQAGRYATTAAVHPMFKLACSFMLSNAWQNEEISTRNVDPGYDVPSQNFPGFAWPNFVEQQLGRERQREPTIA